MKLLKDRKELAMAMNFGRYPVLRIDLADADDYGLKGCRVRIDAGTFRSGDPDISPATLRVYRDERKLTPSCSGSVLSASFTYHDYVEMTENAMAPLIHPDEDVVVAVYNSNKMEALAAILVHTNASVRRNCTEPLGFEAVDMTPFLHFAGIFD